jgi:acetyl-CoA carboxylase biotin carboxyl carrier protein
VTLTAKDVAEISRLLEESVFDELTLELDGLKLSLRRNGAAGPAGRSDEGRPPAAAAEAAAVEAAAPPPAIAGAETLNVTAPLLGTFYRAPKPGAPPFVEVGSAVEAETIIGIIEVMKLMNTVRAGARGTVVDVIAQDGALVEYGETLLRLSKTSQA